MKKTNITAILVALAGSLMASSTCLHAQILGPVREDYPNLVPVYLGADGPENCLRGSNANCVPTAVAMAIAYEQAYCKSIIPAIEGASWPLAEYGNADSYQLVNDLNNMCRTNSEQIRDISLEAATTYLQTNAPWFTHCTVSTSSPNNATVDELFSALTNHLGVCVRVLYSEVNPANPRVLLPPTKGHAFVLSSIFYNKATNQGWIELIDTDAVDANDVPLPFTYAANTSSRQFWVQNGAIFMVRNNNLNLPPMVIGTALYINGRHSAQLGNNQPAGQASTNYVSSGYSGSPSNYLPFGVYNPYGSNPQP